MGRSLCDEVLARIEKVGELYHRLLLIVGPSGSGKTAGLQELADQSRAPLVNVNLELSRRLLDLTVRQRALQLHSVFEEILGPEPPTVLVDNIELLFDPALRQDPLRLLQRLSRRRTLVVSWNGTVDGDHLVYSTPDHPEYCRYPTRELVIVTPEVAA